MDAEVYCETCEEDTLQEVGEGGDFYTWHFICTECGSENIIEQ